MNATNKITPRLNKTHTINRISIFFVFVHIVIWAMKWDTAVWQVCDFFISREFLVTLIN